MKTPKRGNQDEQFNKNPDTLQGRGYHGNQGNMDIYSEDEGYFGSVSQFYGDLPEEVVDTEAIDKEFQVRYDKLLNLAKKALTPNQHRIFTLYFMEHKSQEDVAKMMGRKRQTVTVAVDRILEILRMFESEVA